MRFGEAANPTPSTNSAIPARRAASPKQLKLDGLRLTIAKHKHALKVAQLLAQFLAGTRGVVTTDDVFQFLDPRCLGNAAGQIFRGAEWEFVEWRESKRPSNHARPVRAWRLR